MYVWMYDRNFYYFFCSKYKYTTKNIHSPSFHLKSTFNSFDHHFFLLWTSHRMYTRLHVHMWMVMWWWWCREATTNRWKDFLSNYYFRSYQILLSKIWYHYIIADSGLLRRTCVTVIIIIKGLTGQARVNWIDGWMMMVMECVMECSKACVTFFLHVSLTFSLDGQTDR